MATLNQVNIVINDTGSPALAADDAADIIQQLLALLRTKTLSVAYAVSAPHLVITVT